MQSGFRILAIVAAAAALPSIGLAAISGSRADRHGSDAVEISWEGSNPVSIYQVPSANAPASQGRMLASGVEVGRFSAEVGQDRGYFVLVDDGDGQVVRLAERLVPLQQGSNFRDIGGYSAGGKQVRWGLIYRSAGQPLLGEPDLKSIHALGIAKVVDLRTTEERQLAPTRIRDVPYSAVPYALDEMLLLEAGVKEAAEVYRKYPDLLAPQLRMLFSDLLQGRAPLVYNCSAGQDRTGFATAMILSALGVPRETIYEDYHLSTKARRSQWEMPDLWAAAKAGDPLARRYAQYLDNPAWRVAKPLVDSAGRPQLASAFDEIEARWGSVDTYLQDEIGLSHADIEKLRSLYLE